MTNSSEHLIEEITGKEYWMKNGQYHREDGPAVLYPDGTYTWCLYGKPHRVDGPAWYEAKGKIEKWYYHGKFHRWDGPAIITQSGGKYWYIHGVCITDQVETWMHQLGVTWPWDEETQLQFMLAFG